MHLEVMIDVFHFSVAEARLFGAWHPPKRMPALDVAAVVCPPFGREAAPAHVLGRRTAEELALRGVGALRFDYFGTGDSEGSSTEATLDRWLLDISGAVEEARRRSGAQQVCLVGIRLGALLGAWHTTADGPVFMLCALDPIATGAEQIAETQQLERDGWAELQIKPEAHATDEASLMGIPWSRELLDGLRDLDVRGLASVPAEHVGIFLEPSKSDVSNPWLGGASLTATCERIDLGTQIVPSFYDGIWPPGRAPRRVAEWVEKVSG